MTYVLALITIHDRGQYAEYEAGFMEIFSRYAGEMLVVDEQPSPVEGTWPWTRTVLIRFPDEEVRDNHAGGWGNILSALETAVS